MRFYKEREENNMVWTCGGSFFIRQKLPLMKQVLLSMQMNKMSVLHYLPSPRYQSAPILFTSLA